MLIERHFSTVRVYEDNAPTLKNMGDGGAKVPMIINGGDNGCSEYRQWANGTDNHEADCEHIGHDARHAEDSFEGGAA